MNKVLTFKCNICEALKCNDVMVESFEVCRKCWNKLPISTKTSIILSIKRVTEDPPILQTNSVKKCSGCKTDYLVYKEYKCGNILCEECSKIFYCECPLDKPITNYITRKFSCKNCNNKLYNMIDTKFDICNKCNSKLSTNNLSSLYILKYLFQKLNPLNLFRNNSYIKQKELPSETKGVVNIYPSKNDIKWFDIRNIFETFQEEGTL